MTAVPDSPCPAQQVLGKAKIKIRNFRDNTLAHNAVGRRIIKIYCNNATLYRSPASA